MCPQSFTLLSKDPKTVSTAALVERLSLAVSLCLSLCLCVAERSGEVLTDVDVWVAAPYEGGKWRIHCELPEAYPYKSPSIGFANRIFHPNVDESSGSVCLDALNQTWTPLYDLINIFEVFLPQLLTYPNPSDPMNGEAASLMLRDSERFKQRVRDYVARFASVLPAVDTTVSRRRSVRPDDDSCLDSRVKRNTSVQALTPSSSAAAADEEEEVRSPSPSAEADDLEL